MYKLPETCSVTEFRDNIAEKIKRIRKGGQTTVLTHNGKTAAVVMSAKDYEAVMAAREREEVLQAIREGQREILEGGGREWKHVKADLRKRLTRSAARRGAA